MSDLSNNIGFPEWKKTHSDFVKKYIFSESESSRWGRVICLWEEKATKITHIYAACINLQTGDIYLDCRKRKIWAKCCLYSFTQPFVLTAKTFYHLLLPISIPYGIYKVVLEASQEEEKISNKELSKRIFEQIGKNLADIVRTPLYAIVLTIIGISGVLIGPLVPEKLYDIRMTITKIETALNWGDGYSPWNQFPCLLSIGNLMTIEHYWSTYFKDDTEYFMNGNDRLTLYGLTNLARAQVKFRRNNSVLFNDCFQKYSENKIYISRSTPETVKLEQFQKEIKD